VYIFHTKDKQYDTCPKPFQLQNYPNFTIELHSKIQVKKNMLVKLCANNYLTHDGLVNGVDGIFQTSSKLLNSQQVIWILFNNPKSDQLIKIKNAHGHL
jgi:hypothetical protein